MNQLNESLISNHTNTHLSHIWNRVSLQIRALVCESFELKPLVSSSGPDGLSSVHGSKLSHVPDDTIQANSVKKTNVAGVISELRLWHGQNQRKDVFYSFLFASQEESHPQLVTVTLVANKPPWMKVLLDYTSSIILIDVL